MSNCIKQQGNYPSLPSDMKKRHAFVNWKLDPVQGREKPTKVPYSPITHSKASSTDALTWGSFDQAYETLQTGSYDGIGFVFSSGDPYVFIDLDRSIDPEERTRLIAEGSDDTLAGLKPWARFVRDVYKHVYVGLSQSGTGLHVILRGKMSGTGKKTPVEVNDEIVGEIEMYDQTRFVALTGVTL